MSETQRAVRSTGGSKPPMSASIRHLFPTTFKHDVAIVSNFDGVEPLSSVTPPMRTVCFSNASEV
jgi:hypothetical protein